MGLAISFRSFLMINIIEPIAILLWAFWRIITSVNQNIYWAILVIFCSALMIYLVPAGDSNSLSPAYNYMQRSQGRVEYWQSLFTNALMEKDGVGNLHSNLKELLISIIDQEERSSPMNSERLISLGQAPLPISVHSFLFPPKGKHEMFSGDYQIQLLFLTPKRFRVWVRKFIQPNNTSIDEVLKWMETTMEISHDK